MLYIRIQLSERSESLSSSRFSVLEWRCIDIIAICLRQGLRLHVN